jgi:hypothetical protein
MVVEMATAMQVGTALKKPYSRMHYIHSSTVPEHGGGDGDG